MMFNWYPECNFVMYILFLLMSHNATYVPHTDGQIVHFNEYCLGWTRCLIFLTWRHRYLPNNLYFSTTADSNRAFFLEDFLVTVSNTGFPVTYDHLSSVFTRCGQYSGYPAGSQWGRVTCSPEPIRGRYVYVSIDNPAGGRSLVMCEVRVFGGM